MFVTWRLSLLVAVGVVPVVAASALGGVDAWVAAALWVMLCALLTVVDVATATSPEILLIDEALAVGDRTFREKSAQRLDEHRANAGTVLLVSHNLAEIRRSCERVIWLQAGLVMADGPTDEVLAAYEAS